MPILKIVLDVDERNALGQLAEVEKRDPRSQAAFIIRRELEELGLLSPIEETAVAPQHFQADEIGGKNE